MTHGYRHRSSFCAFLMIFGLEGKVRAAAARNVAVASIALGRIAIAFERCKACELCIPACPKGCIELGGALNAQGYPAAVFAHPGPCTGCALCAEACPDVAIEVWR